MTSNLHFIDQLSPVTDTRTMERTIKQTIVLSMFLLYFTHYFIVHILRLLSKDAIVIVTHLFSNLDVHVPLIKRYVQTNKQNKKFCISQLC